MLAELLLRTARALACRENVAAAVDPTIPVVDSDDRLVSVEEL